MFNTLKGEIIRKGINRNDIIKELGVSKSTFSQKMTGRTQFKLDEIVKITEMLYDDDDPKRLSIEELFLDEY